MTPRSRTTPTKTPDWELSVLGTVSPALASCHRC
jgi:hypothetical protein